MMTRTQIYLPQDMHAQLLQLAVKQNTTLSGLVRQGAKLVTKKYVANNPSKAALRFLANVPVKYRSKLTGKQLIDLVSKDRDE